MKKTILFIIVFSVNIFAFAQNTTTETENTEETEISEKLFNHEVRLNILSTAFLVPELNYEFLFSHSAGVGVAVGYPPYQVSEDATPLYQILPFVRYYSGKRKASGIFIEANMNFYGEKKFIEIKEKEVTANYVGLGLAYGYKSLLSAKSDKWVGELYLGLGLLHEDWVFYPRIGIGIGKRF